jgi:hypothetical protein
MTAWKKGETEKEAWRLTPVIAWVRFPHITSAIRSVFIAYQCALAEALRAEWGDPANFKNCNTL